MLMYGHLITSLSELICVLYVDNIHIFAIMKGFRICTIFSVTSCINNCFFFVSAMSELLFECYNVPSVAYGIDSLFSLYHNFPVTSQ